MCYNNCPYERHNPHTGNCICQRGKNPCPEEVELEDDMISCPSCSHEFFPDELEDEQFCPMCDEEVTGG